MSTASTNTESFNYETFTNYLQGIAGGNRSLTTAKSITKDVQTFMAHSTFQGSKSTESDVDLLLNKKAIEAFFIYLKNQTYQPTTIAEKLRRIKMAIQFILHQTDSTPVGEKIYIRGQKI